MWIGDTMPSGGYHTKKPLTKAQIRKMQEAYMKADKITEEVKKKEVEEQRLIQGVIDNDLNFIP